VLSAFHAHGITVPAQRSIVGFDDIPEAAFFTPGLTTVRQNFDAVGRAGLERLLNVIDDRDEPRRGRRNKHSVLIAPEFVQRASSGRPAHHGRRGRPSATR
jgi:DNA-binding LacI/PurR family transcriptional regulator